MVPYNFSCLAVNDLLRGRPLDDVVDQLPELWENCLRVRDDIKVSYKRNESFQKCNGILGMSLFWLNFIGQDVIY